MRFWVTYGKKLLLNLIKPKSDDAQARPIRQMALSSSLSDFVVSRSTNGGGEIERLMYRAELRDKAESRAVSMRSCVYRNTCLLPLPSRAVRTP